MIDEELEGLARLALCNAFWDEFSVLVNTYIAKGRGLDTDLLEMELGELTSVYGRDTEAGIGHMDIRGLGKYYRASHSTLVGSLKDVDAQKILLEGRLIFKRVRGEWNWVDGN